ncbi:MAG: hypothetical protein AB2693_12650 [Candidatus Thiodiazotropha sp.]
MTGVGVPGDSKSKFGLMFISIDTCSIKLNRYSIGLDEGTRASLQIFTDIMLLQSQGTAYSSYKIFWKETKF